ncbi:MAG: YybH family protein [Rhodospirillaceae bacterium]
MNEDVEKEVTEMIRGIFDAFARHEIGGIEDHMDPDATVWDVFTPHLIRGTAERNKFHADDQEQMQARGKLTLSVDDPVVDVWGDTALARYYLTYKYEPPNPMEGHVRISNVFIKKGGQWKIVHHHEGMVPTGVPPITE